MKGIWALGIALATPLAVVAQEGDRAGLVVRVDARAIVTGSGTDVVVDRGARDLVRLGDTVVFHPRGLASVRGSVTRVEERSATVRLQGDSPVPIGTRAEVLVPGERYDRAAEEPEPEPTDPAELPVEVPEHPPWEYVEEDWTPDEPLLAEIEAVHPEDRRMLLTGRWYVVGDATWTSEAGRGDSFTRVGTDVDYLNPFGRGGSLHVDAEWNYRTTQLPDQFDEDDFYARLDRLSYVTGGTRFDSDRREVGRFLQHAVPELGVLDGYEFGRSSPSGEYSGWSVGFMPEPNADHQTGEDFQVAFNRRWIFEDLDGLSVDGAYQKTFHKGKSDRDLFVLKAIRRPAEADWDFYGTAWIDVYTSRDDVKGSGVELTQLYLSTRRTYGDGSGLGITYSSFRFPELRRQEFLAPDAADLVDGETRRIWIDGWKALATDLRLIGRLGIWRDEDESGGDVEVGSEMDDFPLARSRSRIVLYGTNGKFSDAAGIRADCTVDTASGYWDLFAEASLRQQDNFSSDLQDLPLYRVRASRGWRTSSRWDLDLYVEGSAWQEESAFSVGFFAQRGF